MREVGLIEGVAGMSSGSVMGFSGGVEDGAVLVTGGAGYIGSHAVQRLLREGLRVVCVDNLVRGHRRAMEILSEKAGGRLVFVESDVGDVDRIAGLMAEHGVRTVMHFAALAYVGESVSEPLRYWRANTVGTIGLLEACDRASVERFIFSSTCASYGEPGVGEIPIRETCPQSPINPYGWSKLACEKVLFDYVSACRGAGGGKGRAFGVAALRYFNVAGCDRTGVLGEDHSPETHLIPVVLQAALGKREGVAIFGTDYPTADGTCVRDYVHVEDLIDAHVQVMRALRPGEVRTYNVGIGKGYSVREVIESVRRVTGADFAVREAARREGDPPALYNDPAKIESELSWRAGIADLDEIVASAWAWFRANPDGYRAAGRGG